MTPFRHSLADIGAEYWMALALLGGHLVFVSWPRVEVNLASSNIMTNVIRLEEVRHVPPHSLALAGSSVTGRLNTSFFRTTTAPIVNIGLDGCATMDAAVSLLTAPQEPAVLFLEMNTMTPRDPASFAAVKAALSPFRMSASSVLPFLQAKERPVDLLYSAISSLKPPGSSDRPLLWRDAISNPPAVAIPADPDGRIARYMQETRTTLADLKKRGVTLAFLLVPDSFLQSDRLDVGISISQALAAELDIPIFDLRQASNVESLSWTDGIHLRPVAAQEVVRFIEAEVIPRVKPPVSEP